MKHMYLFLLFILTTIASPGQIRKQVFFIGNSYTYTGNIPKLIQHMAQSTGDILEYEEHVPGGSSFQDHVNNRAVTDKINSKAWDYVVLQEQSLRPALGESYSAPYARVLNERIRNVSPCTKTLFYMTWGRENGEANFCNQGMAHMCTYSAMDDKIYETYRAMAIDNQAELSPVGRVWRKIREQYPAYRLYSNDESHPSMLGSMAAAYTFYTVLFKKDPTLLTYNAGLTAEQATNIKRIVKEVVFDDFSTWFIGVHYNKSGFEYELIDSPSVQFNNTTPNVEEINWDFGDGTTSTELHPLHRYEQLGQFTVTLTVTSCKEIYTVQDTINIETLNTTVFEDQHFVVYPNPTTDSLFVHLDDDATFVIFDLTGKQLNSPVTRQSGFYQLEVKHLAKGTYILQIKTTKGQEDVRFIIK
ncbi:T9SS type A sorting domain-containing protein [Myroides sp. NP-2]|uniref:DUF4886 domain-containing protein n=1 Tax=Myroides sp. NP-2 TaxID=2759945 RepID=UPI0015F7E8DC|nr:DUF4886 domain-containing protein [Myroides sp. NP-2]MBB1148985.1 T9SS type A sorting domain-containing protein [Myroides sp. NP-2]